MKYFSLLSLVFPIAAGLLLMIVRPKERRVTNIWAMVCVCINSLFVFGTIAAVLLYGKAFEAHTVYVLSEHLVLAFAPDGPSLVFGAIIGTLWPVTTVYAFSYMEHEGHPNKFFGFFLITYGVVAGIAFSANFFTLYLCYEFMTLVTLPLVMHEMDDRARSAGRKYLIYSMTGAAMIFVALVFLIQYGNSLDFVYGGILSPAALAGHERLMQIIFVIGFFGFGVKAGIFPLHDWLPSASVAPTPVTALLHAVAVVKSGAFAVMRLIYYGFGTVNLAGTTAQTVVLLAASVTIVFGSGRALRSPHLKRRLAYSTVANLSYILLAFAVMSPAGMAAGLLHMVFHAVIKITLFFCAGAVLHNTGLEYINDLEGLRRVMPVTCGVFLFASLALMGVPPLGGFASKWSIASAAVAAGSWPGIVGACALIVSAILTTLYLIPCIVRFYFPLKEASPVSQGHEADRRMTVPMLLLCLLCLALSLASAPLASLLARIAGGVL